MIAFDKTRRAFRLDAPGMTYLFAVDADGRLVHRHFGGALPAFTLLGEALAEEPFQPAGISDHAYLPAPLEYRAQEPHSFNVPAVRARFADGTRGVRLRYETHCLTEDTLTVTLRDETFPLAVTLRYQLYGDLPLVGRRATFINEGDTPIVLDKMASATFCLPEGGNYRLTYFCGRWGKEYQRRELRLQQGCFTLESERGVCAGHQITPFFALDARGEATETAGEVFFGALRWSGDVKLTFERDEHDLVAVTAGLGEADTFWTLAPGERFETPELTLGYSQQGFERMSETLYDWQLDCLAPRAKAYAERPVIYNSWYPYEFSICEENLLGLVGRAKEIGAELFVVDDGWMPGRENDRVGLGDWTVDTKRFPRGLKPIADACHRAGMQFGLWIEPEMVNPDSALYRAHPDWVLHDPGREPILARNQLVLNFARDEVLAYAIACLDRLIEDYALDYVKWDMNRYIGETGWPDAPEPVRGELRVRYLQNLYAVWEHLNRKYPHVLYENCAGGGGRADFGMVGYADRANRSDNADPVDVLLLHEGFTTLFPPKTAGGAGNISPSPNGINGRQTPLDYRILVGMTGSMSIGINLLTASPEERAALAAAVAEFKTLRGRLQDSYVYRIASLREHPYAVFQYVTRARDSFTVFAFSHGIHFRDAVPRLRLRGLMPGTVYRRESDGLCMTGAELMERGLRITLAGDYSAVRMTFQRL